MPFDPTATRARLVAFRKRHAEGTAARDEKIATEMAIAMVALRQERGTATAHALDDCGFTRDELARLSGRARDAAAAEWHRKSMLEPAA